MSTKENSTEETLRRAIRPNLTLDWEGINSEKRNTLKQSRGSAKSALTKGRNEIVELMSDFNNRIAVEENMHILEGLFKKFETAHQQYHVLLADEIDREESSEYFLAEKQRFKEINKNVQSWFYTIDSLGRSWEVTPEDSVSCAARSKAKSRASRRSRSSSVTSLASSARAKAAAKKAVLQAEAECLERSFSLLQEEVLLQQKRKQLELETEIAKAEAEEKVYADVEAFERGAIATINVKQSSVPRLMPQPRVNLSHELSEKKLFEDNTKEMLPPKPFKAPRETKVKAEKTELNPITVESVPVSTNGSITTDSLVHQMMQHTLALTLPKPEVPVFGGDPLEYLSFKRAFENLIEKRTASGGSRLYYLMQYTKGDVQELVRSCLTMDSEEGYQEACRLLKNRYGQSYRIAAAYVDKLTKGPQIRADDTTGLHKFSVLLTSCKNTLKEIGYLSKVENPDSLRAIVDKLPFRLKLRWRDVVDRITELEKRESTLEDLAKFVTERARAASHPIFGNISSTEKGNSKPNIREKGMTKSMTYATQANQQTTINAASSSHRSNIVCPLCKSNHWLSQCQDFKKMKLDERLMFVRNENLCDNCLVVGHYARNCQKKAFCKVEDCNKKHSTFLHPKRVPANEGDVTSMSDTTSQARNGFISGGTSKKITGAGTSKVGMAILPVKVKAEGCNKIIETYAFLDSGSNTTFCTSELMQQLNVKGRKTVLSLTTLKNNCDKVKSELVSLEVFDLGENDLVELPAVYSTKTLPVTLADIPKQEEIEKWAYLHEVKLPRIEAKVGLLIGSNVPKALEPKRVIQSKHGGPFATETALGWVVNGPLCRSTQERHTVNFIRSDVKLSEQFDNFCKMEFNDAISDATAAMSQEDKQAISTFEESARLVDGHYVIPIPWRNRQPDLPNNRPLADHRLMRLKKRLLNEPLYRKRYSDFVDDLFDKGYAEKIPSKELDKQDGKVWYLPHHSVINPQKPEKTRVVFDCAASYKGTSLNNEVLQGPDLTNGLVGVLMRFREERVAVMADIESMFHQVRVSREDVDALRFLWFRDSDLSKEPQECRMLVHLFGGVWSPSCANFALLKTAKDQEGHFEEEVIATLRENFYVDDCLKSIATEDRAIILVKQLVELLTRGGFRLNKWVSNCRSVIESIPQQERAKDVKDLDLDRDELPIERALGMHWNVETDQFTLQITIKDKPETRRGLLSIVSSVYDPLGFVAPFVLRAKVILQDLCKRKFGWDEALPAESLDNWRRWLDELPKLQQFSVDRCIKKEEFNNIVEAQLHHFSDASETAYGAVSYVRLINEDGDIHCSFLLGKSRLAPVKTMTIPRLELAGATVAVRLDKLVRTEMKIPFNSSTFWTDNMTVLQYIRNQHRRFNTFVANRLTVIHELSSPDQWRHVPGKCNPADDAFRGLSAEDLLVRDNRWIYGPQFLQQSEESWPCSCPVEGDVSDNDPELKKKADIVGAITIQSVVKLEEVFSRFSSWYKLRKFVAWMLRYRTRLIEAVQRRKTGGSCPASSDKIQPISVDEMEAAEHEILKCVQRREFADELACLDVREQKRDCEVTAKSTKKKLSVKKSSFIYKLDPIIKNGLLCVGGRLGNASISDTAKNPVILPKSHHVVSLIIVHFHQKCGHSGQEHVLSVIRERYWITKGRIAVRKVLNDCFSCKKRQASVGEQKMSQLPADRVSPDTPPFTSVGVDCFGPFQVKRARSLVKRYGVLFTCLRVRAVHIEVAHSLDTNSFLSAMRRFIARRGEPREMRSDNGGNFVAGCKELENEINNWNQDAIHEALLQKNIKWKFNPPTGSHHGGVWERCIRTVRKVMGALLKEQTLDDEGLATLMCEIEMIINSRPITKISEDPRDLQALTPNHLLLLRSGPTLPPGEFCKRDLYCKRRWKQVQYMADVFWKRWTKEYLPSLQQRQRWNTPRRNFVTGDIVLVVDQNTPRSQWPLGRILDAYPSEDGYVRKVKVKTSASVYERPIDKIVLLEAVDILEH